MVIGVDLRTESLGWDWLWGGEREEEDEGRRGDVWRRNPCR